MNKIDISINVYYNYGGWTLFFRTPQLIKMPFVPIIGMSMTVDGIDIRLENNDYCKTLIDWDNDINILTIEIREHWKFPVRADVVEEVLLKYSSWTRMDSTNIDDLNKLMERDYERTRT